LLFETGRPEDYDRVIVVACRPERQLRRLMDRDRMTELEARQRIAAQLPIDDKVRRADFLIRTDGPPSDTARQVRDVHEALLKDSAAKPTSTRP